MPTKLSNMRNNKKLMLIYVKETENYVNLSRQDFLTISFNCNHGFAFKFKLKMN